MSDMAQGLSACLCANILNLCGHTPPRSAWMLPASLPKYHLHSAILRGFHRPFVSSCHSPCKHPIWPCHGTGWADPMVLTVWLCLFSEIFGSVQMSFFVPHLLRDQKMLMCFLLLHYTHNLSVIYLAERTQQQWHIIAIFVLKEMTSLRKEECVTNSSVILFVSIHTHIYILYSCMHKCSYNAWDAFQECPEMKPWTQF